jgi:hypothetical protein
MKKILIIIALALAVFGLAGCSPTKDPIVLSNLTYQEYLPGPKNNSVFLFHNKDGEQVVLYDKYLNSQYINQFTKGAKYDLLVSVEDSYNWGGFIKKIQRYYYNG